MKINDIHSVEYTTDVYVRHMQSLAKEVLDSLIPIGSHIVLIDYPNTTNVGDSLIWLGEMAYLKSREVTISYVCDIHNYSARQIAKVLRDDSILLLHGGGNFGTVWRGIQDFRLKVLKDFKNCRIIQFPQTIYFDDESYLDITAKAIEQHGNFTLLTRCLPSYERARTYFNTDIKLCPDMAFFIGSIPHTFKAQYDYFVLSRSDHEKSELNFSQLGSDFPSKTILIEDWLNPSLLEKLLYKLEYYTSSIRLWLDPYNLGLLKLWNILSLCRLQRGVKQLAQGNTVITDRLHVHILSTLIGKPHILVDNNYGKLSGFFNSWSLMNPISLYMENATDLNNLHELNSWLSCKHD